MKKLFTPFLLLLSAFAMQHVKAQEIEDAGVYMKAINKAQADFNKTYMSYISAAWHSTRAAKIDRLRQQVVDNLTTCRYKIIDLPIYKHDNALRQANIDYLWLLTKIFNDDYSHLVNMESLIDQSFDQMELYLLFEEKINDTLKAANDRMAVAEKNFAAKYNVTLVSDKSDAIEKMDVANKVAKYRDKVYLLFFKCGWQESQLIGAISKKNLTKIEQARSALQKYAADGFTALDSLNGYDNDVSLETACKQALTYFKKEAETEITKVSDFLLKQENFTKIKTTYDSKPKNTRTKQEEDLYTQSLNDVNASFAVASAAFKGIFADRDKVIINWNSADQKFSDKHVPYYR